MRFSVNQSSVGVSRISIESYCPQWRNTPTIFVESIREFQYWKEKRDANLLEP